MARTESKLFTFVRLGAPYQGHAGKVKSTSDDRCRMWLMKVDEVKCGRGRPKKFFVTQLQKEIANYRGTNIDDAKKQWKHREALQCRLIEEVLSKEKPFLPRKIDTSATSQVKKSVTQAQNGQYALNPRPQYSNPYTPVKQRKGTSWAKRLAPFKKQTELNKRDA